MIIIVLNVPAHFVKIAFIVVIIVDNNVAYFVVIEFI